jgi:hypothetical protein
MKLNRLIFVGLAGTLVGIGSLAVPSALAAKPCDGCVGNADNKTPGGQSAGDRNNGYECDANAGVGQGNPAHSHICEGPTG